MKAFYYIKRVPTNVKRYFNIKFPVNEGFSFEYYVYYNSDKTKKWFGCFVSKDGELWSYCDQADEEFFNSTIPQHYSIDKNFNLSAN